jgi:hypothetical protein
MRDKTAPKQSDLAAIAAHLRERGPLPGKHILEELVVLDESFPGVTVHEFIQGAVIALTTEGSA